MDVDAPCPACGGSGVELRTVTHEIEFFGEVVESILRCDRCGYRTSNTLIAEQSEPTRHALAVDGDGLSARVIRSTSCTVRVPDLGVTIEPAMASDAYITNVEGILQRIESVLVQVRRSGDDDQVDKAKELQDRLHAMAEGEEAFEIVLEDPLGNSAIVHDDVEERKLTPDEVEELQTGRRTVEME